MIYPAKNIPRTDKKEFIDLKKKNIVWEFMSLTFKN